jgi:hypothetical protein
MMRWVGLEPYLQRGKEGMTQESIPLEKITYAKTVSVE